MSQCLNATQLDGFQSDHGFAAVGALIGNVVNSDSGLAIVHETANARGVRIKCRSSLTRAAHILTRLGYSFSSCGARATLTRF